MLKHRPSALSSGGLALIATLGALLPRPAVATPTFIQGVAFSTPRIPSTTVALSRPVAQGDLLVGWFSQYNAPGEVQVSDNVNGTWTRAAAGSLTWDDDTGDIALYYRENSRAAPGGITVTVSASPAAYLQGAVAEYSGIALAGALDQIAAGHAEERTPVDTGPTPAVGAGELVFAAMMNDVSAGSVTPGSSQGVRYTARAQNSNVTAFAEDITSSAAGAQHGTATLGSSSAEWYAVCAVFHPYPATPPTPPSTPTGLGVTSVASTRVALSWLPSGGSVAGYAVYRDGSPIGTTRPDTTIFIDEDATPATTHTYSVDAFDLANDHSAPSAPLTVTTPTTSPEFIQGAAASSGSPTSSRTLTLTEPVQAGDLLVGWFSQYGASGQVRVSDNVNGPWTRSVSTTWSGTGDIALYYRENSAPAPSGLAITVSASASAYLQEAVADFRHVATVGALDQALVSQGTGTYASVGPTAPVPAGELVVAAVLTGGRPGWATPGSSPSVPYLLDVHDGSASSDLEDILSSAAAPQQGSLTLGAATNWYMVLATFRSTAPITTTTTSTTPTRPTTTTTTLPGSACSRATVIPAAGGTFTGTTSGTSSLAGTCGSSGSSPEQAFQWTPAVSGPATIETCGSGTTYDSVLYLRAASCATGAEVQCNDDACANSTGLVRASRLTPSVTAGTTYYIVVDGYAGSRGSFALRVTPPGASTTTTTAPTTTSTTTTSSTTSTTLAGAACGSATVIPAGGGTFTGTTSGTSTLAGTCGISGLAPERVFQWTPTTSGIATIQTCGAGTNYDSVLYVRSPTCTSPEVTAGCNDDACPNASGLFRASKVMPSVTAGQTYFIVVDGYAGSSGSFTLSVTPP